MSGTSWRCREEAVGGVNSRLIAAVAGLRAERAQDRLTATDLTGSSR